jgi:hypothetical protein
MPSQVPPPHLAPLATGTNSHAPASQKPLPWKQVVGGVWQGEEHVAVVVPPLPLDDPVVAPLVAVPAPGRSWMPTIWAHARATAAGRAASQRP